MRPGVLPFTIAVFAAGLAVCGAGVLAWDGDNLPLLLALSALTAASEVFDFSPFPNSRVSLTIALIIAAALFAGLPGAVIVATVAAAVDLAARRKALIKAAFNHGALALTGAAFWATLEAGSFAYDDHDWLAMLAPALAGAAVAFAVNSALVALVISLDQHRQAFDVWRRAFAWLLPHFLVLCLLGLFIAMAYDRWEVGGIAVALAPLAAAWALLKQYVDRVRVVRSVVPSPHG
jgi:hypothetical protein